VLDALGSDEAIGHPTDLAGLPTHDQHLETIVVVQVNMERGDNQFVVIVLQVRQRFLKPVFVMVIDQRDRPGDFLVAELLLMFHQVIPNHVGDGQGPVIVTLLPGHLGELPGQGGGHGHAESGKTG